MAATSFDLVGPHAIEKGFPWEFLFTRLNPDRTPIDLTGCRAELVLLDATDPTAAPLRFNTESGHVALGGAEGTTAIRLSGEDTGGIAETHSRYRLTFIDAAGNASLFFRGRVGYLEVAG
jgi:hypothetical protein